MSVLGWVLLGLIAGFIGSKIVNRSGQGFLLDIVARHRRCGPRRLPIYRSRCNGHHGLQSLQHVRRHCGCGRRTLGLPRHQRTFDLIHESR